MYMMQFVTLISKGVHFKPNLIYPISTVVKIDVKSEVNNTELFKYDMFLI